MFVAGIYRESDYDDPILGIHRPYLSENDLKRMRADQAVAAATNARTVVENYLRTMSVPARYVDEMFSVSRDDLKWVSNDDFEADFKGFIPELREWVDARCNKLTPTEKRIWDELKYKTSAQESTAEKVMGVSILRSV